MQLKAMIIKKKITRDANIETDRSGAMDKAAGDIDDNQHAHTECGDSWW